MSKKELKSIVPFPEHVSAAWKRLQNDSKHELKSLTIRFQAFGMLIP
jgi:hypothetical protein